MVAIDGPAASGKSSTARMVAERLGVLHIDSGSLYRAATAAVLSAHPGAEWGEAEVLAAARGVCLAPDTAARAMIPLLGDRPLGEEIRSALVTQHVSRVAQMPGVREWVNDAVRCAAVGRSVVVDGRDIGTVVFPDARVKIFLVADPWERARRRLLQRSARAPTDEEIAAETERLVRRDAMDATQTVQARDAILVDTTHLTQEEQVDRIVALAHAAG
ncbi:MAG TPA: (d)CMP kinase [Gemmatimonadaceae bacterium]|nr:(d)CMP kinase [Gemmatimonadaceae bacterium]